MRFEQVLRALKRDYPELEFRAAKRFKYRAPRSVYYEHKCDEAQKGANGAAERWLEAEQNNEIMQLLHEVGHALLGHYDYALDVERVKMERAAWEKACELCEKYGVEYDGDFAEAELDSYREWLYQRSKCGRCGLTRYQRADGKYVCVYCGEFGD